MLRASHARRASITARTPVLFRAPTGLAVGLAQERVALRPPTAVAVPVDSPPRLVLAAARICPSGSPAPRPSGGQRLGYGCTTRGNIAPVRELCHVTPPIRSRHKLLTSPCGVGARARRAAPPQGAGPAHGRRGARPARARLRPADRARAHRPAVRRGRLPETGSVARRGTYGEEGELVDLLPANTVVGNGRIDGRRAVVQGDDFTVRGGAADAASGRRPCGPSARRTTCACRSSAWSTAPAGRLASRRSRQGFTYVPPLPGWEHDRRQPGTRPRRAAALGPVAGLGAARVVASHFSVIVRDTAQMFVAGPPVVAAAMGEAPNKEELGGAGARTAPAPSTTRPPTRRTRSRRSGASSPTCPPACGSRRRCCTRATRSTGARTSSPS